MNNLYDVLEICLKEIENGADMESVLARYPELAAELRPILNASIKARTRGMAVPAPSLDVLRRGRAKLLQHASEMRESKAAPRRRMIPLFQRLAISFTLTALFLASGTGLVSASSSALPGENLYHVKLTWESVRLFFTFDHEAHELLEHAFENERLHEINELLAEGRHETIQFSGAFMEVNGQAYVSGIRIVILDTTILPADKLVNGTAVIVTGRTNAEGFVEAEFIELLPAGTVVPIGEPPEEKQFDKNDNANNNDNGNDNANGNDNENENDNANGNENNNGNDNGNENSNDNGNGNDNENENENENENSNDNGNGNENGNDNGNENGNTNGNDNDNGNTNENDNGNGNDNGNDNSNDNGNENGNDNGNDNSNDNGNENDNDNDDDNDNSNENTNDSDSSNDNDEIKDG